MTDARRIANADCVIRTGDMARGISPIGRDTGFA